MTKHLDNCHDTIKSLKNDKAILKAEKFKAENDLKKIVKKSTKTVRKKSVETQTDVLILKHPLAVTSMSSISSSLTSKPSFKSLSNVDEEGNEPNEKSTLDLCSTLDPIIRLDYSTSTNRNMNNTPLDPNSTSSLDPSSSLHTTNSLHPTNLKQTYLRTGNTVQDENFFHNIPEKQLETETEEPEEDFSHLSLEEQSVLRQISLMIRQPLLK